jgi:hypothetical protein
MPTNADELGGYIPEQGEDPFFCLLEDDDMVTHVSVTTDTMLQPVTKTGVPGAIANLNDVRLVITVKLKPTDWQWFNMPFGV